VSLPTGINVLWYFLALLASYGTIGAGVCWLLLRREDRKHAERMAALRCPRRPLCG
jgi:hypothetical protein